MGFARYGRTDRVAELGLRVSGLIEFNRNLTTQWGKMYEADDAEVAWHGTSVRLSHGMQNTDI